MDEEWSKTDICERAAKERLKLIIIETEWAANVKIENSEINI